MSRAWKVALLLALVLLFGMVVSLAWGAPQKADEPKMPVFSVKDHKLIEDYYNHLVGTPGSRFTGPLRIPAWHRESQLSAVFRRASLSQARINATVIAITNPAVKA